MFIRVEECYGDVYAPSYFFDLANKTIKVYRQGFNEIAINGHSIKIEIEQDTTIVVSCSMDNPHLNCFNRYDGAMSHSFLRHPETLGVRDSGLDSPKSNPNEVINWKLATIIRRLL